MAHDMAHNQFELLRQRRFLPFFLTQALGAFNDNVYRQAIIGLLFWLGVSAEQRTLYTNLAPALFILPYFLFSATAGQIAEKLREVAADPHHHRDGNRDHVAGGGRLPDRRT